jgi:hypothetical protein
MPRKKVTVPIVLSDNGPAATRKSRVRKILTEFRQETGDPWDDGEIWLARIAMTRRARIERRNGEKDWRRYYKWYEGQQWNDRGDGGGQINSDNARDTSTVNKTGSIINSIRPFLINDEIKFLLKAQRPTEDDYMGVKIQQALLNYEWRERNMTRPMKACALDLLIIGHCVAKSGYTVEVDESRKPNEDGTINYADYVKQDAPFVERVNPLNFLFDLSAKDHTLHTARWCAEVFFVPYVDVLSNKTYDSETLAMLSSGSTATTTMAAWEMLGVDPRSMKAMQTVTLPEDNLVALIEIWDWKHKNRIIYADGCPRPLLVEDWPYDYLDKFPYAMDNYIDVPNQPYGLGLPCWIEDQQIQLNRMATLEQDVARKSRPRVRASEGTNPDEVEKYKAGDDIVVGDFQAIQLPNLPQDFQVIQANIQRAIEEMTGADALLQGGRLPSRTTAGEVGTRARLTGLKLDQHVEDFEEFVEDIATQVLHHLKKHRTVSDVIEITGEDGASWQEYTSEQIQDDVDVDVEYFSAPKTDMELEKQQALQIFQLAVQALPVLAQTGAPDTFNMPALVGWVLDKFGEKDIGRFFRSSRTPMPTAEGSGMTPAIGGAFAPSPISPTPTVGAPGEGGSVEDLMMSLRGGMQ